MKLNDADEVDFDLEDGTWEECDSCIGGAVIVYNRWGEEATALCGKCDGFMYVKHGHNEKDPA